MWDLSRRVSDPELMDTVEYPAPVLRRALAFLDLTNRRFGGAAVVFRKLEAWSASWSRNGSIHILDVGTGGGDIPLSIVTWARRRAFKLKVTALDSTPTIAEIARLRVGRDSDIEVVIGDLFELARGRDRFDYVIASLFLHHVRPDDTVRGAAGLRSARRARRHHQRLAAVVAPVDRRHVDQPAHRELRRAARRPCRCDAGSVFTSFASWLTAPVWPTSWRATSRASA
jgi:hypothetical protein